MEERLKKFLFEHGGSYWPKSAIEIKTISSVHPVQKFILLNGSIYVVTLGLVFDLSGLPRTVTDEIFTQLHEELSYDRNLF